MSLNDNIMVTPCICVDGARPTASIDGAAGGDGDTLDSRPRKFGRYENEEIEERAKKSEESEREESEREESHESSEESEMEEVCEEYDDAFDVAGGGFNEGSRSESDESHASGDQGQAVHGTSRAQQRKQKEVKAGQQRTELITKLQWMLAPGSQKSSFTLTQQLRYGQVR